MSTIDEKVVEMRFDNSQFEKNAQTSMNTIDELKSSLKFDDTSKNFKDINAAASGVNFDVITSALETVHQKFSALEIMATTALVNITNKAVNAGEQLLKSLTVDQISAGFSKYENKTSAVQTIMAATAKDFDDEAEHMEFVNAQLDKLNWYTDETSAGFLDMVNNIGKFTSSGVKLDTAVEAMEGIANWGYISGASLNEQSRAMYNLSQALATGSVKLIDWKSIENANMATMEFKQTVIDTAVAQGTLKKVGDGVYQTMKGNEVSVTNFNNALSDAWFSSDVLLDSLSKYGEFTNVLYEASELTGMTATELLESIDEYKAGTLNLNDVAHETGVSVELLTGMYKDLSSETYDLGIRSFKAAQEAKTFTEAIDAVKDAVSTGWLNTFETIFGDYREAKELWTNVANELYDTFAEGGNARNQMLKEWKELGGRDLMIEAVANAWYGVKDALGTVKKAFREIFPAMDAERLVAITEHVRDLTASFRRLFEPVHEVIEATGEFDEEGNEIMKTIKTANPVFEMLKNAFKGIFAVAKIVTMALSAIWGGVKQVLKMLTPLIGVVLKVSESFGNWLVALQQQLKTSGVFKRFVQIIVDTLKTIPVLIDWISQKLTGMPLVEVFQNGAGRIKKTLTILGNFVKNFMETFVNAFRIGESQAKREGDNLFWQIASGWIRAITKTAAYFADTIFNALEAATGINFSGIRDKIHDFFIGLHEVILRIINGISVVVINLIKFIKAALPYVIPVITWVVDTTITVVKTLVDYLSKLPSKINEMFQKITGLSVGEAFTKLKDAASGMLEKIKEVFKGFREVDTDAAGEFSEKTEKKLSPLTKLFEGLKKFFSGILEVLKALRPIFSSIFDLIGKGLSKLGGAIGGFAKDGGVNKLIDLLKSGIVISILLKIRKMFSNGAGALGGIKDIISNTAKVVKNIGDVIGQVGETLKAFQQQIKAKALLSIAIAIGILTISLIALAGMDTDQVTKGVAALSAIALVLSKTFKSVTNSNISGPKALGVAAILLTMGIAILLMASAVKKMGKLDPEVLTRGLIGVAGLMIGLVLVMKALSSDSQSSKRMMKGALGLIAMAIAIRLLVKPVKQLGEMKMETLKQGLLALGALLLGVALFVKMTGGEKKMMSIGVGLILVAFALKLMIGSVKKMGEMDLDTLKQGMLALGALLLGVALFTAIVGNTKGMIKAAVALIIIVTAIGIMVAEVAALGKMETENLVKGLIAMVVILGAIAAFTKLVGSNLGAALTITIIAGAMLILAAALVVLSAIPGKKLAASLLAVIAIIVILVATMYAIKTAGLSETMTKFGMALLLIGAGIALAGVGVLALSVGLSILAAGGSAAAAALALLIATLIDALAEGMPKIIRTLLSAAGQILDGIVELTPKIIAAIKAILEGLLDLLNFADQNSVGYKLVKTIFDLTKQVLNGILDMLDFDDPNTPGHKLIKAVVSLISQLLTEVENRSESWTKSIVGIISGIIKGLNAKVPELIEDVVTLVCNILDSLGKNIGRIIESTIVFLCNVLEGLAVAIEKHRQEIIDAVWSAVSAIISLILGLFGLSDEDIEMLFVFCAELVENINKGIEQAIDDFQYVGDFFHDLIFNGGEPSDEGYNDGKDYGDGIIKGLDESQEEYEKRNSKMFELYKQRGQEFFETFNKLMGIGDYAPKKDTLSKMLELTNVHLTDALGNAIQFKNLMDEMNGKPFTNQYILDISQAKTAATELSNAMNGIDGGSITIKASNEASSLLNNMNSNTLDLTSKIGKLDNAIEAFNKKELTGNVYISENSLVNTIVGSVNSKLGQLANQQGGLAGMVLGGILKGYK